MTQTPGKKKEQNKLYDVGVKVFPSLHIKGCGVCLVFSTRHINMIQRERRTHGGHNSSFAVGLFFSPSVDDVTTFVRLPSQFGSVDRKEGANDAREKAKGGLCEVQHIPYIHIRRYKLHINDFFSPS